MTEEQIKKAENAVRRIREDLRNTAIANRIETEFDLVTKMARDYINQQKGATN